MAEEEKKKKLQEMIYFRDRMKKQNKTVNTREIKGKNCAIMKQ